MIARVFRAILVAAFLILPLRAQIIWAAPKMIIFSQDAQGFNPQAYHPGSFGNLVDSGPIKATYDGQIIENLYINTSGTTPAIEVTGIHDVTIRNVIIKHAYGRGISIRSSNRAVVENVRIINTIAPIAGPHTGNRAVERVNLAVDGSDDFVAQNVYLERGSSGINIHKSLRPKLFQIQGFDFRGPYPRGQLVQFDKCVEPVLDTFSVINPGHTAWTEDAVNSYGSVNPVIRNGYIEGINSPTGVGVLIENTAGGYGGLVENVDVRYWVNGAFMAAHQSKDVVFRKVRAFDGLALAKVSNSAGKYDSYGQPLPTLEQWAGSNFRGGPSSGQQAFLAFGASTPKSIKFIGASYKNLPRNGRVAWDKNLIKVGSFHRENGAPREPFTMPLH